MISESLLRDFVYVLGIPSTLKQAAKISALAFTSHLHRVSSSEVINQGLLKSILSMCIALYMYVVFWIPEICWSFSNPLRDISFPRFYIFVFKVSFLLSPTDSHTTDSHNIKWWPLIVFDKCLRGKAVHSEQALELYKDKLYQWRSLGKLLERSSSNNVLELGFLGSSKHVSPLQWLQVCWFSQLP